MTHPHAPPDPSPSDAGFLHTFLGVTVGLVVAVAALSWLVDPLGAFGTGLLPPAVTADRDQKAALYRQLDSAPGLVILGSSRAKTLDPACLSQLTGRPGFNFAVNGADAEDFLAIIRFLRSRGSVPGMILVGVEPEVLQGGAGERRALAASRALAPFVRRPGVAERLATLGGDLLGWQAVHGSIQSIATWSRSQPVEPETVLEPDGLQRYPRAEAALARGELRQDALVRRSVPGVLSRYASFSALDSARVADLIEFLHEARAAGASVIGFIPPVHPALDRAALGTTRTARTGETVTLLRRLESEGLLRYRETRDLVAASPDSTRFIDAVHFLAPVARRLARTLVGSAADCAVQ